MERREERDGIWRLISPKLVVEDIAFYYMGFINQLTTVNMRVSIHGYILYHMISGDITEALMGLWIDMVI